ncbi:hypothetical protein N0V82_001110 [Gnomoniopsis sp. IMI 355080]|nr:hypothetical protein N0V82_001110 [Gnomoniopsis sp. IMI 355080]
MNNLLLVCGTLECDALKGALSEAKLRTIGRTSRKYGRFVPVQHRPDQRRPHVKPAAKPAIDPQSARAVVGVDVEVVALHEMGDHCHSQGAILAASTAVDTLAGFCAERDEVTSDLGLRTWLSNGFFMSAPRSRTEVEHVTMVDQLPVSVLRVSNGVIANDLTRRSVRPQTHWRHLCPSAFISRPVSTSSLSFSGDHLLTSASMATWPKPAPFPK